MGREFASAAARWIHLRRPRRAAARSSHVCDTDPDVLAWYERLDPRPRLVDRLAASCSDDPGRGRLLRGPAPPARRSSTSAILEAGKHLLGEKPFGIDLARERGDHRRRSQRIPSCSSAARRSCRSTPAARRSPAGSASAASGASSRCARSSCTRATSTRASRSTGSAVPSSTARTAAWATSACTRCTCRCARAGCRANVRAILSDVVPERPDGRRRDGAVRHVGQRRPALRGERRRQPSRCAIETKRIAPGETNTWVIEIDGTEGSIAFTTKYAEDAADR